MNNMLPWDAIKHSNSIKFLIISLLKRVNCFFDTSRLNIALYIHITKLKKHKSKIFSIFIYRKGDKERIVAITDKPAEHLKNYIKVYHEVIDSIAPLIYTAIKGRKDRMSIGTSICSSYFPSITFCLPATCSIHHNDTSKIKFIIVAVVISSVVKFVVSHDKNLLS